MEEEIRLRGGFVAKDPRLDRIPQFDPRSRNFPIRTLVEGRPLRAYTWRAGQVLDQGSEGACVGFAWAHEMLARPKAVKGLSNDFARNKIYKEAQKIDEWAGEAYDGTSVLAGAKIVQRLGYMPEYRWAFGLEDALLAIGYAGPGVAGLNWYSGMFRPDEEGYLRVTGSRQGGHAIVVNGVDVKRHRVKLHNSWGESWGDNGMAFLDFDDFARLLGEDGEFCVPIVRRLG